jgi:predicted nucleotidyltransferase
VERAVQAQHMTDIEERGLQSDWKCELVEWASRNDSVREVWLFGSRGPKGGATSDSDLDVGLVLMPAIDKHDWALGKYIALGDTWQAELAEVIGRHVSLELITHDDTVIRSTGVRIWERTSNSPEGQGRGPLERPSRGRGAQ